jgi:hypothetical protein
MLGEPGKQLGNFVGARFTNVAENPDCGAETILDPVDRMRSHSQIGHIRGLCPGDGQSFPNPVR